MVALLWVNEVFTLSSIEKEDTLAHCQVSQVIPAYHITLAVLLSTSAVQKQRKHQAVALAKG